MSRYILSPVVFQTSADVDLYVIQTFGKLASPERIRQSWLSVATLYLNIGDLAQSEKFLLELLRVQPHHKEANDLLGTVYRRQGRLELALEFYERQEKAALCDKNAPQIHALDAAEICIQLARKQSNETEIKKLVDKSLFWIERTRLANKKYVPQAVQLLHKACDILIRHAERQSDKRGCLKRRKGNAPAVVNSQWINDSMKELLTVEETFIDPGLHVILTKAVLKLKDYQRAWKHVVQRRYNFVDNLEWNMFVKNTFQKRAVTDNSKETSHETTEMIFFAYDNVVRLSLKFKSCDESGKLVKQFSDLVNAWDLSSQNVHQLEKWTRYQQEYRSRSLRHDGYFQLKIASSDLSYFRSHKRLIKDLYQGVGENNLKEAGVLKWLTRTLHHIDKIISIAPYDLDRFLTVSAWHLENGVLRDWLRDIFPRLLDFPKVPKPELPIDKSQSSSSFRDITSLFVNVSSGDQLGAGFAQFLSRQDVKITNHSAVEPPTLVDVEFFLLMLLVQRHYHCVVEGGAETIGQILYLEAKGHWKPSESQRRFWWTLLNLYGK
ncbi:15388_t:CDS:10, partial [Acaulospora morrowiae]